MTAGHDEEIRRLFEAEATEQLDRMADTVLSLERAGGGPELVATLFRDAHTLKSSAALVGLPAVAEVAHLLEDLLGELRAGTREVSPALADGVLVAVDALRALVEAGLAGAPGDEHAAAARNALKRGTEAEAPPGASLAPAPVAPGRPAGAAPARPPERADLVTAPHEPSEAPEHRRRADDDERLVSVGLDRLDELVRLSGEAVTAQLRLVHLLSDRIAGDPVAERAVLELRRAVGDVQAQTMRTRMTSLEGVAGNLRRAVRDVARASGKSVDYALEGERVELDRAVLDGLRDPLLHLVRNAVDHGLEEPDRREALDKPRTGTVAVTAARRGSEIVVSVVDDGRGLDLDALRAEAGEPDLGDQDAARLVFRPGLSTADAVTDVSGRGVGLDAVRTAVEALRGRVDVASVRGAGCRFTVTVPLTLAIVPCVLLTADGRRYHLPTHAVASVVGGEGEVGLEGGAALWVGGEIVPVSSLTDALDAPRGTATAAGPTLVLEGSGGQRHAFRVDAVHGQRDVTVKDLGAVVPPSRLVAGASIEADGSVVLVLDPVALVEAAGRRRAAGDGEPGAAALPAGRRASVLVVDDALTVRELQRSILERAGYEVRLAADGEDALARLAEARPDLVITDVQMPRLDGFGLVAAIRASPVLRSLPVLMLSAMAADDDRRRGLDAGADAYLVKQDFDADRLLAAVTRVLGA